MRHDVSDVYSSVFLLALNIFCFPYVQRFEHCVEKRLIKCHHYYQYLMLVFLDRTMIVLAGISLKPLRFVWSTIW